MGRAYDIMSNNLCLESGSFLNKGDYHSHTAECMRFLHIRNLKGSVTYSSTFCSREEESAKWKARHFISQRHNSPLPGNTFPGARLLLKNRRLAYEQANRKEHMEHILRTFKRADSVSLEHAVPCVTHEMIRHGLHLFLLRASMACYE
jgi:hypothetical protein